MKNNEDLQKDVQEALKWEPLLHAAEIGVTAKDGIITLSGTVDSYAKKLEAENAARSVAGVKAVVEAIHIKYDDLGAKSDSDIAVEVVNALKWSWQVPADKVKVEVEDGWVKLEGEVKWHYQKDAAKTAIKTLIGVQGITNNITIKSETNDKVEKADIEFALGRNWAINKDNIDVKVLDNNVTLTGVVPSWYQRDEAERIAWNAPGVSRVHNDLVIEFDD